MENKNNFDLSPRNENKRDKLIPEIVKFNLAEIKSHFDESASAIRALFSIANHEENEDMCNIWRAQIVFLVSAFDFYMHEITKFGLCEIFDGNWGETVKFKNTTITMRDIKWALENGWTTEWFLQLVNNSYSDMTMVSYKAVKDQMSLLGIKIADIAKTAFYKQGSHEKTDEKLKRRLNELYHRRNIIAHQADRAHTDAQKGAISMQIVKEFIDDTEKIVSAIDQEIQGKCM